MILPCGTADYCRYLAQWSDSDTTLVVLSQQWGYKPVNTPLLVLYGIMHSCVTTYKPSGFALVLYVVTALVHYIPYSTSRGVLTITNQFLSQHKIHTSWRLWNKLPFAIYSNISADGFEQNPKSWTILPCLKLQEYVKKKKCIIHMYMYMHWILLTD